MRDLKFKCWDEDNERWVFENSENEFSYNNGKWKVRYEKEINLVKDGIEMDVPVWVEIENPIVEVVI